MPVTNRHRDYEIYAGQWQRLRDAFLGQDAVKAKNRREQYLPRLEGQKGEFAEAYEGYLTRALWAGYALRTLTGLVGAVFRKDPAVTVPPLYVDLLEDITLDGMTFVDFSRFVFREAMSISWYGILVEQPSAAEAPADVRRPFLKFYAAESIRNWRWGISGGVKRLTQLVLAEEDEEPDEDGFGTVLVPQFRVLNLNLNSTGEQTTYTQQLWREQATTDERREWQPYGPPILPDRRGELLDFIPFYPGTAAGMGGQIQPSRLLDLVDVNFDHYRLDADYKHGLHFTALPTAWVAGFPVDSELRIGSQAAWITDNPNARAGFLEFSGMGLAAIATAKESDERIMAVLGARLLEESKRSVEAAETIHLRQAGEESIVKAAARAVSGVLTQALWALTWWAGADDPEVSVQLNTDIISAQMSPTMLAALVAARQSGEISQRTFLEALVAGEVVVGRTWEEEQALIALTSLLDPPEDRREAA